MLTGCSKFPNRSVQTFGFVYHDTNGFLLAGLLSERQFEKILLKHGWEKIPNWECLFVHRGKGLFLSVYVDYIKIDWKETKS